MNRLIHIAFAALIIAMACRSSHKDDEYYYSMEKSEEVVPITQLDMESPPPPPAERSMAGEASSDHPLGEQKLIRTAHIRMEVAVYEKARLQIDSLTKHYKAWVQTENLYNYDYRISNDMSLRVPSVNLDNLVTSLQAIAKKIEYQGVETTDVTEEYIDVQSRLKNQKLVEQKFLGLLRRTDSIDDILKIETKLAEVRGQIESIEGRLKYLNNRVDYSTIYLNVFQRIDYKYEPVPMESFWERLKKSLDRGWKGFVAFLLFLIRIWPLWIIGLGVWFLVRFYLKKKGNQFVKGKKKKKGKDKQREKDKKNLNPKTPEQMGE